MWEWFKNLLVKFFTMPAYPESPVSHPSDAPASGYRAIVLERWRKSAILPLKAVIMEAQAKKALQYRAEFYDPVEKAIGLPWWMVAALDMRESSFNHNGYLGNGDPWNKKSVHVPSGRGPFSSWHEGAIDALKLQGFDKINHWDIVTCLIQCEIYNGLGYKKRGMPSPYVWAGTNIQVPGKYVADGKFDANAVDSQPGCVGLFLALKQNHGIELNEA